MTDDAKGVASPDGSPVQVCRRFPAGDHVARCDCPPDCGCPLLDAKAVDSPWPSAEVRGHIAGWAGVEHDCAAVGCLDDRDAKAVSFVGVCSRWQEVRGDRLAFSCECGGEGCPHDPRDAKPVGSDRVWRPYADAKPVDSWAGGTYHPEPRVVPLRPAWPNTWGRSATLGVPWFEGIETVAHTVPIARALLDGEPAVPSTREAVARIEAEKATHKARARRKKARRVARVADKRRRGIPPPCAHDCDRGDDW